PRARRLPRTPPALLSTRRRRPPRSRASRGSDRELTAIPRTTFYLTARNVLSSSAYNDEMDAHGRRVAAFRARHKRDGRRPRGARLRRCPRTGAAPPKTGAAPRGTLAASTLCGAPVSRARPSGLLALA